MINDLPTEQALEGSIQKSISFKTQKPTRKIFTGSLFVRIPPTAAQLIICESHKFIRGNSNRLNTIVEHLDPLRMIFSALNRRPQTD